MTPGPGSGNTVYMILCKYGQETDVTLSDQCINTINRGDNIQATCILKRLEFLIFIQPSCGTGLVIRQASVSYPGPADLLLNLKTLFFMVLFFLSLLCEINTRAM